MEWLDRWITKLPGAAIVLAAVLAVLCVGWFDRRSGLYLSLALFYLGPIAVVTWRLGRSYGMLIAGFSAVVGLVSDSADVPGALYLVPIANACTRLIVFWLIVIALDGLRRRHEAERQMARTDPLTGVSNARHFREEAGRQIAGSRRYGFDVCLAYLDLDRFKAINDTFGHSTGDALLKVVGDVLSGSARPTDLVARIGGDEFVILLPHTDQKAALTAMDRYREALTRAMDEHGWAVTVSAGMVALNDEIASVDELIGAADASMYLVKRAAGRDEISPHAPPLPRAGASASARLIATEGVRSEEERPRREPRARTYDPNEARA